MAKKSRKAAASPKPLLSPGRSNKNRENHPPKRKASGERQVGGKETTPKKVRFSESENGAPGTSKQSTSESDLTKRQKRGRLPRFLKPELRTIKKTGSVFDKVKLTATGKPNWAKIKEESSKMRKERKEKKQTHFEIILQIKNIWEVVRHENCPVDKRAQEILKLLGLVQSHLKKLVYAHDTSRIVQGLMRLGSPSVRTSLCDELTPELVEMMQNKFSAFIVKSILKYGEKKSKADVLEAMKGNVVKLMTNSASAPLVEHIYTQVASPDQKIAMEKEFLGRYLATMGEPSTGNIADILSKLNAENRTAVFENIKENIVKVTSKGIICSTLLIQVTLHFVEVCSQEDKKEVLSLFGPNILDIISTKPGSRLGMQYVWFSDKKAKKQFLKKIKGNVLKLASSENSFWIILALLDAVDDIVLLNKVVVSEIATDVLTLLKSDHGRKVLKYLIAHRDTATFHPQDIEMLKKGDGLCLKSMDKKREELSPVIYDFLLRIPKEVEIWLANPKVAMVTMAVLKHTEGEKLTEALTAIAKYVCSDVKFEDSALAVHPSMSHLFKGLLHLDQSRKDDADKFSVPLASFLKSETIMAWILSGNYGFFLLTGIFEAKSDEAIKTLVAKITRPHVEEICKSIRVGARILLSHLKNAAPHLGPWESTNTDG